MFHNSSPVMLRRSMARALDERKGLWKEDGYFIPLEDGTAAFVAQSDLAEATKAVRRELLQMLRGPDYGAIDSWNGPTIADDLENRLREKGLL